MCEPRPLATLGASTVCNRDYFTFNTTFESVAKLKYSETDKKNSNYIKEEHTVTVD
jgi:hypothetical protein